MDKLKILLVTDKVLRKLNYIVADELTKAIVTEEERDSFCQDYERIMTLAINHLTAPRSSPTAEHSSELIPNKFGAVNLN